MAKGDKSKLHNSSAWSSSPMVLSTRIVHIGHAATLYRRLMTGSNLTLLAFCSAQQPPPPPQFWSYMNAFASPPLQPQRNARHPLLMCRHNRLDSWPPFKPSFNQKMIAQMSIWKYDLRAVQPFFANLVCIQRERTAASIKSAAAP